jgi:hypothetical protein
MFNMVPVYLLSSFEPEYSSCLVGCHSLSTLVFQLVFVSLLLHHKHIYCACLYRKNDHVLVKVFTFQLILAVLHTKKMSL